MNIRIKASEYELTLEARQYLEDRLASLEKMLGDDAALARCEVELGRAAGGQRHGANMWFAEIHIKSPGGAQVYARNNSESINGAIDDVKEEAERQVRKGRKLHIRIARKTGSAIKNWLRSGRSQ